MNFSSEYFLITTFLTQPMAFFRKVTGKRPKRHYILKEFDSGYGVADIVIGSFAPYFSKRYNRSTIDPNWVVTLVDVLKAPPFTVDNFAEHFGVSQKTAREKLNQFVAAGFLKLKRDNYSRLKGYKITVGTTIAIEAKLKKWKQALNQARRYKRFANYSFVLLDKQYSMPAVENVHIFKQHNIGLISMCGHKPTIHHSPKQNDVSNNMYFYKLNEAVYGYFRETYGYSEESDSK